MSREKYREPVDILRRLPDDTGAGGGVEETYAILASTTCEVRDEKYTVTEQDQAAPIVENKIFSFRAGREILPDDMIRWRRCCYEILVIDEFDHRGREVRVHARRRRGHWRVRGENV